MILFQEKFNITEQPITISVDVNRYAILIIIKKDWEVRLNPNFMNLFGFSQLIFLMKDIIEVI